MDIQPMGKVLIMKVTVAYLVRLAEQDEYYRGVLHAYQEMAVEEKETYFILK